MHSCDDLIVIFNACFLDSHNTCLIKGGDEPVYLPATIQQPHHHLIFRQDYFASALHECSHWLIAGEERRKRIDFGYWYEPDGRTTEQQALFQQVEVKPQALEWVLSVACDIQFRISIDNLNGNEADTHAFKYAVYQRVQQLCQTGLSHRTTILRDALCNFYYTPRTLNIDSFDPSAI